MDIRGSLLKETVAEPSQVPPQPWSSQVSLGGEVV